MTDELVVTSGREWRRLREKGQLVELASGFVVRLRPVSIGELVLEGMIPNTLIPQVNRMMGVAPTTEDTDETLFERGKSWLQILKIVCTAAMMQPKIVDDPQDEYEISFYDLTSRDRDQIFSWVTAPQEAVQKFRPEQDASVEPVSPE